MLDGDGLQQQPLPGHPCGCHHAGQQAGDGVGVVGVLLVLA